MGVMGAASRRDRRLPASRAAVLALLALGLGAAAVPATEPAHRAPVRIAVFEFELDDASPEAVLLGKTTNSAGMMAKVSSAARQELEKSGRYSVIDASKAGAAAVAGTSLRNCDGCEARVALRLGAEQSLIGVVRRATQTDYYIMIRIRDARTGRILDEQEANFAGGEEGWASGVRMLIKHQILASPQ